MLPGLYVAGAAWSVVAQQCCICVWQELFYVAWSVAYVAAMLCSLARLWQELLHVARTVAWSVARVARAVARVAGNDIINVLIVQLPGVA